MGYFTELNVITEQAVNYDPLTRENEHKYLQLREEINLHIAGELAFDQLSPTAKEVVHDWESYVEDMIRYDQKVAEEYHD